MYIGHFSLVILWHIGFGSCGGILFVIRGLYPAINKAFFWNIWCELTSRIWKNVSWTFNGIFGNQAFVKINERTYWDKKNQASQKDSLTTYRIDTNKKKNKTKLIVIRSPSNGHLSSPKSLTILLEIHIPLFFLRYTSHEIPKEQACYNTPSQKGEFMRIKSSGRCNTMEWYRAKWKRENTIISNRLLSSVEIWRICLEVWHTDKRIWYYGYVHSIWNRVH